MAPSSQDAARRLLILLAIVSHALRLMLLWDFVFRTAAAVQNLTGSSPRWRSLGLRGEWLKLRARWNWFWGRRALRRVLRERGLVPFLTCDERKFLRLGLTELSRAEAHRFLWHIEAAACIAWALRLLPRLWPMDEQFDGKLDFASLGGPQRHLVQTATLRPVGELEAAGDSIKLWHWRARQLALERQGYRWPPQTAAPDAIADLQSKGLDTLDGLVRVTARLLREQGKLDQTIDDDFVAKGKAYRQLSEEELSELLGIASERHKALNWLRGLAPDNDWEAVPTET